MAPAAPSKRPTSRADAWISARHGSETVGADSIGLAFELYDLGGPEQFVGQLFEGGGRDDERPVAVLLSQQLIGAKEG